MFPKPSYQAGFSCIGTLCAKGALVTTCGYRAKRSNQSTVLLKVFEGHTSHVTFVEFDGKRVVSGSDDKTVRIWGAESGKVIAAPWKSTDCVTSVQVLA